jgi:hypothetical protein
MIERVNEASLDKAWAVLAPSGEAQTELIDSGNLRAAIAAYLSAEREAGRAMMPLQPTIEMCDAPRGLFMLAFERGGLSTEFPLGKALGLGNWKTAGLNAEDLSLTHIPPKRYRADMVWRMMCAARPLPGEAGEG